MENLSTPYVNMNGDSIINLNAQLMAFFKSLDECTQNLAKCEYNNGRNATDGEHQKQMRDEKTEVLQTLGEIKEKYIFMFKEINKKEKIY